LKATQEGPTGKGKRFSQGHSLRVSKDVGGGQEFQIMGRGGGRGICENALKTDQSIDQKGKKAGLSRQLPMRPV